VTAGELVRDVRKRHGLTQERLAARASTSQAAISRIERDLVSPTVESLVNLLRLMNEQLILKAEPAPLYSGNLDALRANLELTPSQRIEQGAALVGLLRGNRQVSDGPLTLHFEIARILDEHGRRWMTTSDLAAEVNSLGRYGRADGGPVTAYEVHGRTKNYREVFKRRGSRVRLAR
jgi:transcriptional regulator with XRE-family HTH domain